MRIHSSQRRIAEPEAAMTASLHTVARLDRRPHTDPAPVPPDDGRIGALLVAAGVLAADQAEQVARAQVGARARFGETAVALGFATQEAVDTALARQFDFAVAPSASQLHPSLITARGQRDRASELVRSLRANLAHMLAEWPTGPDGDPAPPAVTVASLTGAVGRRLIASNLAIASAQAGVPTLLVDADMRQPTLHVLFAASDRAGLSTFLAGRCPRALLQRIDAIAGLQFLAAGPIPPNPTELLARLGSFLPRLRAESGAAMIIINPPPLDVSDDLLIIAAAAPAVLMVTRRDFTRARALTATSERLRLAGATIIGSVLNVA